MKCRECGAENKSWGERCVACGARLKSLKFKGSTKVCLVLSMAEAVCLTFFQLMRFIEYIPVSSHMTKGIWILIMAVWIAIAVNTFQFWKKKKKKHLVAACLLWGVYLVYSILFKGSPIFSVIVVLPVLVVLFRILPQWKYLE